MSARNRVAAARPAVLPPAPAGDALLSCACLAACLLLAAVPVVLADCPPIFDYPNHLARAHVIARLDTSPVFRAHFQPGGFVIPNVLADVLVLALMPLGGTLAAGRLLLVATFALTLSGALALNRAVTGRFSPWPLFAATLLYNEGFFWGFLNYNLGLALLLWGLALWIAAGDRPAWLRLAVGAGVALLVFFAHLVAFGLYACGVAAVEARRLWLAWPGARGAAGRLAVAAGQFVPALAVFLGFSPSSGLAFVAMFDFSLRGKVMPFARILSSGNPALDFATLAATAVAVAAGLASRTARAERSLLLVAGVYLGLVMGLPYTMMGSYFLDSRIVVAVALVAAASLGPGPRAGKGGRTGPAALAALALLGIVAARSAGLAADWRVQDRDYAAVLAGLGPVPPGSVVVTAVGHDFELGDWIITRRIKPSHEHTTSYLTIDKSALVPNIFARAGQNPLVFASSMDELNRVARNPVPRIFSAEDARALVAETQPIADRRRMVEPAIPGVFVVAYRFRCDRWPLGLPIRYVHCGRDFSVVEVVPALDLLAGPVP